MRPHLTKGRVPADLIGMHDAGKVICVVGRFSDPAGWLQAVNDFLSAVDFLVTCGVDIRDSLPDKMRLVAMLKASKPVESTKRDGGSFKNSYVTLDFTATHGVVCVLSCGSGHQLDKNRRQPFVDRLAEILDEYGVAGLFATRIDRLTRVSWAFGPVMLVLEGVNGYLADTRRGFSKVNGPESILTFFEVRAAEDDAAKIPKQTRRGMRSGTEEEVADGQFRIGFCHPLPPGMFSYRSLRGGAIGTRIGTFDTPSYFPSERSVAAGLPDVRDDDGSLVDQVANVRWALSMLGRPGWGHAEVAAGLAARRFSTDGVRRLFGPDAVGDPKKAITVPKAYVDPIFDHLSFYETGVLLVQFGVEGVDDFQVSNCFPPDGEGWATPEDFVRIREYRASVKQAPSRGLAFAQVPVCVDGVDCYFVTKSFRRPNGSLRYTLGVCLAEPYDRAFKMIKPKLKVHLPAGILNRALAVAIIGAGESAYTLIRDIPIEAIDESFELDLALARTSLRGLQDENDVLRCQLVERGEDGLPMIRGALLRELNDRFNRLADNDIPAAEQLVLDRERTVKDAVAAAASTQQSAALGSLLHLVASLRDPFDSRYRDLLTTALRNCTLTSNSREVDGATKLVLIIDFEFVISDGDTEFVVPVSVEHIDSPFFADTAAADALLEKMRSGPATLRSLVPDAGAFRAAGTELALRLGVDKRRFMLHQVADPRLSRLVSLVLDLSDLDALAVEIGEPVELLRRLHLVHTTSATAKWCRPYRSNLIAAMYDIVATGKPVREEDIDKIEADAFDRLHQRIQMHQFKDHWTYKGGSERTWNLPPCPHCRSPRRRPATIPDPDGLICQDCRRDEGGHLWPADPYDAYLLPPSSVRVASDPVSAE